jgi:hypothetical protein
MSPRALDPEFHFRNTIRGTGTPIRSVTTEYIQTSQRTMDPSEKESQKKKLYSEATDAFVFFFVVSLLLGVRICFAAVDVVFLFLLNVMKKDNSGFKKFRGYSGSQLLVNSFLLLCLLRNEERQEDQLSNSDEFFIIFICFFMFLGVFNMVTLLSKGLREFIEERTASICLIEFYIFKTFLFVNIVVYTSTRFSH